ncbi:MAG: 2-C-methyl-D-erythritol 4-phosphate cytidylyltransferase [Candidatus Omnitrophica bacterium]|nr:2-C-methyl-D-erythritol 4-phosphate cytidylyltransferase [Candidatus Omnitrophota bacterium]
MLSVILLAAGSGKRLKTKVSKVVFKLNSRPLVYYSLCTLSRCPEVNEITVVANAQNIKSIASVIRKYQIKKVSGIVLGGKRRQDSVANGLKAIDPKTRLVLIHDGARPFIEKEIISSVIKEAEKRGAAIVGVPVKATIKEARSKITVKRTLDRSKLWEIQTPQVFKKGLILKAYKKFNRIPATDDAGLVEKLGVRVGIVLGSYNNIKITTPEDLLLARGILKGWKAASV